MSQSDTHLSHSTMTREETVSVVDLWLLVVKRRSTILGVTLLFTLAALAYAILISPVYKSTVTFLPPKEAAIQELNTPISSAPSPNSIYAIFKRNLNSIALQRVFFSEKGLSDILKPLAKDQKTTSQEQAAFARFRSLLHIETSPGDSDFLRISLEWASSQKGAQLLNDYVAYISEVTKTQVLETPRNKLAKHIERLKNDLEIKRRIAYQRRNDRLMELADAIKIAERLDQQERIPTFENQFTPLYYRGKEALQAELDLLTARKSADSYIKGLRDLQEQIATLSEVRIKADKFHVVTIDQPAIPPLVKDRPKRSLIVSFGIMTGFIAGLITVLFLSFVSNVRQLTKELQTP